MNEKSCEISIFLSVQSLIHVAVLIPPVSHEARGDERRGQMRTNAGKLTAWSSRRPWSVPRWIEIADPARRLVGRSRGDNRGLLPARTIQSTTFLFGLSNCSRMPSARKKTGKTRRDRQRQCAGRNVCEWRRHVANEGGGDDHACRNQRSLFFSSLGRAIVVAYFVLLRPRSDERDRITYASSAP